MKSAHLFFFFSHSNECGVLLLFLHQKILLCLSSSGFLLKCGVQGLKASQVGVHKNANTITLQGNWPCC